MQFIVNNINVFIVTSAWDYEGNVNQWIYVDEAEARAQFDYQASLLKAVFRARNTARLADSVTLEGPFPFGSNVLSFGEKRVIAHCHPAHEAKEAAYQARLQRDKEKRAAKKAAAKGAEATNGG